jgi:hypothetical protein
MASSTLHFNTPQPWTSSNRTETPKSSSSLAVSSRVVKQLLYECRMYVGVFQLNRFENQPRNSPTTGLSSGVPGMDVGDATLKVGRGDKIEVGTSRSSAVAETSLNLNLAHAKKKQKKNTHVYSS